MKSILLDFKILNLRSILYRSNFQIPIKLIIIFSALYYEKYIKYNIEQYYLPNMTYIRIVIEKESTFFYNI